MHLTKSRAKKHGKPWTLKSGGLDPRSLTEFYAYECNTHQGKVAEDIATYCFIGTFRPTNNDTVMSAIPEVF